MTVLKTNDLNAPVLALCNNNNKKSTRFSNRNLLKSMFNSTGRCHRYEVRVGDYCGKTMAKTTLRTTRQLTASHRRKQVNTTLIKKRQIKQQTITEDTIDHNRTHINKIQFGQHTIDSWFLSPYPPQYCNKSLLYICEYCFKYMSSLNISQRHQQKCRMRHPPGHEIYRQGKISIFEVDGSKNKVYCQNLCLLTKLFLNHKTLFYDVEPFLFYIMTETDEHGCHFVGYFSKEKESLLDYNVCCILILPTHQRKGYGQYLIDFSYLLTKQEKTTGSPEKPLSHLGKLSYQSYWKYSIYKYFATILKENKEAKCSIEDISTQTGLIPDDVVSTLQEHNMIKLQDGQYALHIDERKIVDELERLESKRYLTVDPANLIWKPFQLPHENNSVNTNS